MDCCTEKKTGRNAIQQIVYKLQYVINGLFIGIRSGTIEYGSVDKDSYNGKGVLSENTMVTGKGLGIKATRKVPWLYKTTSKPTHLCEEAYHGFLTESEKEKRKRIIREFSLLRQQFQQCGGDKSHLLALSVILGHATIYYSSLKNISGLKSSK